MARAALGALLLVLGAACPAAAQTLVDDTSVRLLRQAIFSGLASQVGNLPNPSTGGFTFELDPILGVPIRTTEQFGPIFAERAETTGRGKITLTASYTQYTFDKADGVRLDSGDFRFFILGVSGTNFRLNLIELRETVRAEVFTLGASYGVTDRIDVGVTIPIVRVSVKERFRRTAFFDCPADFREDLGNCTGTGSDDRLQPNHVESTGLGDVAFRAKYHFWGRSGLWDGRVNLAAALEVKAPTGDEGDRAALKDPEAGFFVDPGGSVSKSGFRLGEPPRGTGIVRVKPQLIASGSWFGFAPHVNVGFELGETEGITNDLVYAVGFEYRVFRWLTLAADLLGRHAIDEERARVTRTGPGGTASPDTLSAALGLKVNPFDRLLLLGTVLLPLNDTGVRDDLAFTVGLEWSF